MAKQTFTTGQVLTAAQMTSLQQTAMLGGSASAKVASYTLVAADAGTTVSMSNAGATTITVNTGLFAAGDTVTILNTGAGTCTITAGTATVSKPTNATLALITSAGGVLYFTATGAATFLPFDVGAAAVSSTAVGCQLKLTSNFGVSNGTQTAVDFTTEQFDTNSFHDNSTNTSRITIPAGYAGKYLLVGSAGWDSSGSATDRGVRFTKNGTALFAANMQNGASGTVYGPYNAQFITLAVSDYVEMQVIQYSGGSLICQAAQTFFGAMYLGA